MSECTLGLVVNPIAGMGGSVGLKGTDGRLRDEAVARGALPGATERATVALRALAEGSGPVIRIVTAAGAMGADSARGAGFRPDIVYTPEGERTDCRDTRRAAAILSDRDVDLLVFAGGDGTARDVLAAVGRRVPVLGIPCGVKMHSGVFAATPRAAADALRTYADLANHTAVLCEREVMDRDPGDGDEVPSPRLYGCLRVPRISGKIVAAKAGGGSDALLQGACRRAAVLASDERITLLGPGGTMQAVKSELGFDGTLLGVDAVRAGRPVGRDLSEREILELIRAQPARIVIGIVGGQGFLFGRGNQQLSARVIRAVGVDNVFVVASGNKLAELPGGLLVDTGDEALDRELSGYIAVRVAARRSVLTRVRDATSDDAPVRIGRYGNGRRE